MSHATGFVPGTFNAAPGGSVTATGTNWTWIQPSQVPTGINMSSVSFDPQPRQPLEAVRVLLGPDGSLILDNAGGIQFRVDVRLFKDLQALMTIAALAKLVPEEAEHG